MTEETSKAPTRGHGFGTFPVFLAAISTILGAIMFLRFGWAVGQQGIWGALLIVLVGEMISIPTALAISEIATNRKVEGGGEYYIISRSFGTNIGGSIGIALYLSQAISVAFYLIAFAQAFQPIFPWIKSQFGIVPDPRMFSIPMAVILAVAVIKKGASMGVAMLWIVVSVLFVSLVMFFLGGTWDVSALESTMNGIPDGDKWVYVFAVTFPAFTGMTAGVGLSGDLKNPRRSIPLGTLTATLVGAVVYVLIILKLGMNASSSDLATDELIMSRIAVWGPIIPIGLAAATLSSAIGSLLIAPRTLQALSNDGVFPGDKFNKIFSKGVGKENEPLNATYLTMGLAFIIIILGDVNMVAKIVSQFFMVTYGTLCLISVMEHFAASPSYRPSFRSRWWISLIGAVGSVVMMVMMEFLAALVAITFMTLIYLSMRSKNKEGRGIAIIFKGALYQMVRKLQIWLQKNRSQIKGVDWRPSFIAISASTFERLSSFDLLRWIAHRHGFGTYFHYISGVLTKKSSQESKEALSKIIKLTDASNAGIYAATIISPSFVTAVAQIIQVPGVAGMDNNGLILEFSKDQMDDDTLMNIQTGIRLAMYANFNVCVLRSTEYRCGFKSTIHLWLNRRELVNANLMILLAYIIMGHPDWKDSEISVFAAVPEEELAAQKQFLDELIKKGRIPISMQNVQVIPFTSWDTYSDMVEEKSQEADLVIMGFTPSDLKRHKQKFFTQFSKLRDVLFVRAEEDDISLVDLEEEVEESVSVSGETPVVDEKKESTNKAEGDKKSGDKTEESSGTDKADGDKKSGDKTEKSSGADKADGDKKSGDKTEESSGQNNSADNKSDD